MTSGAREKRPELDRLLAETHRPRFDAAVVWRFAPFARSVSYLLQALEAFNVRAIEFARLSEQFERVKAGLRNARARGERLGSPGGS